MKLFVTLIALLPLAVNAIDEEYRKVTCGSIIKLAHSVTENRLTSLPVSYGSGSQQQSVTGVL